MEKDLKELLLKDLSARLPYGVKVNWNNNVYYFTGIYGFNVCVLSVDNDSTGIDYIKPYTTVGINYIKPYLFPMSSMTEEQEKEYDKIIYHSIELHHREYSDIVEIDLFDILQDFYCKNHLDYRGLIEKGLALDATGLNIY